MSAHKRKLAVLTGAGISAESGLKTFRDGDGLWENHRIEDVATPEAWLRNPELVTEFYNQRRRQATAAQPNAAHIALAQYREYFDTTVITQNIDDLHERAGQENVIHVHGQIMQSRCQIASHPRISNEGKDLSIDDKCECGERLRPHVVWFGETVEYFEEAAEVIAEADSVLVVGTSLSVFPVANLIQYAQPDAERAIVSLALNHVPAGFEWINSPATEAVPALLSSWSRQINA